MFATCEPQLRSISQRARIRLVLQAPSEPSDVGVERACFTARFENTKRGQFAREPFAIHFRRTFLGHYTGLENEAHKLEIAFRAMILRTLFRPGRFELFWSATCNLFFG